MSAAPPADASRDDFSRDYLDMLAAERRAAANTLAAYRRDLDNYLGYLNGRGLDPA